IGLTPGCLSYCFGWATAGAGGALVIGLTPCCCVYACGLVTAPAAGALVIGLAPGMVSAWGAVAGATALCLCFAADAVDAPAVQAIAATAIATMVFLIIASPLRSSNFSLSCGLRAVGI